MTYTPPRDHLGFRIKSGDLVHFADGRTTEVLGTTSDSVSYQDRRTGQTIWVYSFLVGLDPICEPPASVQAQAVVAQAADMQGASHG